MTQWEEPNQEKKKKKKALDNIIYMDSKTHRKVEKHK